MKVLQDCNFNLQSRKHHHLRIIYYTQNKIIALKPDVFRSPKFKKQNVKSLQI